MESLKKSQKQIIGTRSLGNNLPNQIDRLILGLNSETFYSRFRLHNQDESTSPRMENPYFLRYQQPADTQN